MLTDARYFVKNRGNPNFRITLPDGTQLWSATVNGVAVVPVKDVNANLIPLPQRADPNAVLTLDLKLAALPINPTRVTVAAPVVAAPVMLAEWKLQPDTGQRLVYRAGSLTPVGGVADVSGFAGLARIFKGDEADRALISLFAALILVGISVMVWRWTAREGVYKFSPRHLSGLVLGLISFAVAVAAFISLGNIVRASESTVPRDLTFLAPVQQASSALSVEVANAEDQISVLGLIGYSGRPVRSCAVGYAWMTDKQWFKPVGWILGWTLIAWTALRGPTAPGLPRRGRSVFGLHIVIPALRELWRLPKRPSLTAAAF